MKVTVEDSGPCRKLLKIEVPAEQIDKAYEEILGVYQKSASIPGFRKGRAPQNLVAVRYAKHILQGVKDQVVPKAYQEALDEQKLDVVSIIDVKDHEVLAGQPLELKIVLDVRPDFELPEYLGISLQQSPVEITDENIEETQKGVLENFVTFEDVEDRPVEQGDLVQVDFFGTIDGDAVDSLDPAAEGLSRGEGFWVRVDENSFLPGFGDALVGASVGDERTFPISFEEGFTLKVLAGRTADYTATVKALKGKKLPELDEALFKKLGVESEDELKERIREDLARSASDRENDRFKKEIIEFLMGNVQIDLPKSVVEQETRNIIYNIVNQNTSRGISREEIEGQKDQIFEAAGKNAEDRVKLNFILDRIAQKEEIKVSTREVDQRIDAMAARHQMDSGKLRSELEEKEAMDDVEAEIRQGKTIAFLLEKADIKE